MECVICGKAGKVVHLSRSVGMIFARKWITFDGPLCREHARSEARRWLGLTLLLGWWGVISFFANFVAIIMDVGTLVTNLGSEPESPTPSTTPTVFGFRDE
jgi:hypothetical protein